MNNVHKGAAKWALPNYVETPKNVLNNCMRSKKDPRQLSL